MKQIFWYKEFSGEVYDKPIIEELPITSRDNYIENTYDLSVSSNLSYSLSLLKKVAKSKLKKVKKKFLIKKKRVSKSNLTVFKYGFKFIKLNLFYGNLFKHYKIISKRRKKAALKKTKKLKKKKQKKLKRLFGRINSLFSKKTKQFNRGRFNNNLNVWKRRKNRVRNEGHYFRTDRWIRPTKVNNSNLSKHSWRTFYKKKKKFLKKKRVVRRLIIKRRRYIKSYKFWLSKNKRKARRWKLVKKSRSRRRRRLRRKRIRLKKRKIRNILIRYLRLVKGKKRLYKRVYWGLKKSLRAKLNLLLIKRLDFKLIETYTWKVLLFFGKYELEKYLANSPIYLKITIKQKLAYLDKLNIKSEEKLRLLKL